MGISRKKKREAKKKKQKDLGQTIETFAVITHTHNTTLTHKLPEKTYALVSTALGHYTYNTHTHTIS